MFWSKLIIVASVIFMLLIILVLFSLLVHLLLGIFANEVPFVASRSEAIDAVIKIDALYKYPQVWDIGAGAGDILLAIANYSCKNQNLKNKKIKLIGVEKYLTPFTLALLRHLFSRRCVRKKVRFKLKDAFKLKNIPKNACFFFYMLPAFLEKFYSVLEKQGFPKCIISCVFKLPTAYNKHYKLVATKKFEEDSLFGSRKKEIYIYQLR